MKNGRKKKKERKRERERGRGGGDTEPAPTNRPETQQVKQTNPKHGGISAFSPLLVDYPYIFVAIQI